MKKKYYLKKRYIGDFMQPRLQFIKSNKYIQYNVVDDLHHHILYSQKRLKKKNFVLGLKVINYLRKKSIFKIILHMGLFRFSQHNKIFKNLLTKKEIVYSKSHNIAGNNTGQNLKNNNSYDNK